MVSFLDWWGEISPAAQEALLADPFGPIPGEFVVEIAEAGGMPVTAFWPDHEQGPSAFHLPDRFAQHVEVRRLFDEYRIVREQRWDEERKYFTLSSAEDPVIDDPRSSGEVDLAILAQLRDREAATEAAYRAALSGD